MKLEELGYSKSIELQRVELNIENVEIGQVILEHKERYCVKTEKGEFEAEITGNLRFSANSREDFPAVGDWVAITTYDSGVSIIHKVLNRYSTISRQAVGQFGEKQIIATNIDYALIVQAADRDFNVNRLERYLTICNASKVNPIIVLTKIDLIHESEAQQIIANIKSRIKNIPILPISNESLDGFNAIKTVLEKGKTYCLLGSSGVGKSTLLNNLTGKSTMQTKPISLSTNKGKHSTSHRELIILENGAIVIDNPGMREVGIADASSGLEITFDQIFELSKSCKFKDCTHTQEVGCAVLASVENNEINMHSYQNYLKMEREKSHFESTLGEKRKKDKDFGKMLKNYKKNFKKQ